VVEAARLIHRGREGRGSLHIRTLNHLLNVLKSSCFALGRSSACT
jgi:hypothetical protein